MTKRTKRSDFGEIVLMRKRLIYMPVLISLSKKLAHNIQTTALLVRNYSGGISAYLAPVSLVHADERKGKKEQ